MPVLVRSRAVLGVGAIWNDAEPHPPFRAFRLLCDAQLLRRNLRFGVKTCADYWPSQKGKQFIDGGQVTCPRSGTRGAYNAARKWFEQSCPVWCCVRKGSRTRPHFVASGHTAEYLARDTFRMCGVLSAPSECLSPEWVLSMQERASRPRKTGPELRTRV